ncbi:MOSC domain-containing protein [Undibacterium sp. SXout20W]|uniref:MOSC domain-containing protein n=1 Tax=Undibacterium sp. SXout20W TaxID=3413051 RepID=UPI003BF2B6B7
MPSISELTIYPIKSCAGIAVSQATVTEAGLRFNGVHDREWMLVDLQGQFISQREFPLMARVQCTITNQHLQVDFDGMTSLLLAINNSATPLNNIPVVIWDFALNADDAGDVAAAWFSQVLGTACRLVRFSAHVQRFANTEWTGATLAPTRFSDGYPLLLISEASLEDLNQKAVNQGRSAVPMNRFRPNIVIDGIDAFEEDYAASFDVSNRLQLRPVKPCPRCPMPAVDQKTGIVGANPVDILQPYRANPIVDGEITFGMNVIVDSGAGATIAIGDEVQISIAF